MGGDVGDGRPLAQEAGDIHELLVCQLGVIAHDNPLRRVRVLRHGQARPGKLRFQGGGAADVEPPARQGLLEVGPRGLGGGDEVLRHGGDAHPRQARGVVGGGAGGVVGQEAVVPPGLPEPRQQRAREGEQPLPQVERAVQVEEIEPQRPQPVPVHGCPSFPLRGFPYLIPFLHKCKGKIAVGLDNFRRICYCYKEKHLLPKEEMIWKPDPMCPGT